MLRAHPYRDAESCARIRGEPATIANRLCRDSRRGARCGGSDAIARAIARERVGRIELAPIRRPRRAGFRVVRPLAALPCGQRVRSDSDVLDQSRRAMLGACGCALKLVPSLRELPPNLTDATRRQPIPLGHGTGSLTLGQRSGDASLLTRQGSQPGRKIDPGGGRLGRACVLVFDQSFSPLACAGVELVESLDDDTRRQLGAPGTCIPNVARAADPTPRADLPDCEPRQWCGVGYCNGASRSFLSVPKLIALAS
jgi:hypothetical protein